MRIKVPLHATEILALDANKGNIDKTICQCASSLKSQLIKENSSSPDNRMRGAVPEQLTFRSTYERVLEVFHHLVA
ncbi:hypothetical protein TNIN_7471 [Trichonephila inaurata madagascariensis]|uniref:Uncharacterized protein n=1 Tax=Trichonephila inaurata madagascariensis TaxID=2747483 RepID=A0A8X6WM04_9ARAC|nr:hypothetical protein TNIN_7471 [Trichonephila inaurata madagascariensis]